MKQAVGPNDLVYQLPVQNYGYIEYNDQGVYWEMLRHPYFDPLRGGCVLSTASCLFIHYLYIVCNTGNTKSSLKYLSMFKIFLYTKRTSSFGVCLAVVQLNLFHFTNR